MLVINAVLLMLLAAASVTDIRARIIPNTIPVLMIALFFAALLVSAEFRADWPWRLASFGVAFAIGFYLFVIGVVGGGDVKLFAALALFHTLTSLTVLAVTTAFAGGVIALLLLADYARQRWQQRKCAEVSPEIVNEAEAVLQRSVPYGVGIFLGQIWVMSLAGRF